MSHITDLMSVNFRETTRRRRAARAETRQQNKKKEVITIDDEDDPPRGWRCTRCPVGLEAQTVRVLIPCGHVYCDECAEGLKLNCSKCKKSIEKCVHPVLQESEPLDLEAETKRIEVQSAKLEEEIRLIDAEYEQLRNEQETKTTTLKKQVDYFKELIVDVKEKEKKFRAKDEKSKTNLVVVDFLHKIESRHPFPFASTDGPVSAIYLLTAVDARGRLRELRTEAKRELDAAKQEYEKAKAEAEIFAQIESVLGLKQTLDESVTSEDSGCPQAKRFCVLEDEDFEN